MKKFVLFTAIAALVCAGNLQSANPEMDSFINELMSMMNLQEKIGQLNLLTPGGDIPTGSVVSTDVEEKIKNGQVGGIFGISGPPQMIRKTQELAVNESRLGIPLLFGQDVIHGYKTVFPIPIGLSCSWDMELIEKTARIAAREATADGINWNFSPMIDVSREPRWGRVAEGGGEDPHLNSEIARAMVRGYQQNALAASHTMMSTAKHFALYGAPEGGRDYNTVDMSRTRMFNIYMPPFKAAIEEGVGCIMTAFNDVEGVPATGNRWLLTGILRERWNFDGFVISDYTSVNEMVDHGLGDLQAVSALALRAGLDMDMVGEGFLTTLEKSLKEGKITEAEIDNACRNVLRAKYKLGLFEDPYRYIDETLPEKEILTTENRRAARDAASRSFVLLKNDGDILPLDKKQGVALIGPLADEKSNMMGTWAVSADRELSVPVLEGMRNVAGEQAGIRYAKGANIHDDPEYAEKVNVFGIRIDIDERSPEVMLNEAVDIASGTDVIVAVIGEASEMSGESSSRSDISLPESQKKLVRALAETGRPLVLVMMSGRPLTMEEEYELADAILFVWHPGIEAGNAIADVLYGIQNPSGKLTMTFPRNVGQIPVYYNHRFTGRPQEGDEFVKFRSNYLDVPNSPLLTFGYGLSYTTFDYSNINLDKDVMKPDAEITLSVTVTNTGDLDGEEVVQMYIHDVVRTITQPVKKLKGFEKVFLRAGESKEVTFTITIDDLSFYDNDVNFKYEPGEFIAYVGTSSDDVMSITFTLLEK
jgi:beta-glucosidase